MQGQLGLPFAGGKETRMESLRRAPSRREKTLSAPSGSISARHRGGTWARPTHHPHRSGNSGLVHVSFIYSSCSKWGWAVRGLNSGLTTRVPSLISSVLSVSTQATQVSPPPFPIGAPLPALAPTAPSSPVLPARPSLPGRAAEAKAPVGRGLPVQGAASSSRSPPRPLPLQLLVVFHGGGDFRDPQVVLAGRRRCPIPRSEQAPQEGRTDGRSADGRREEEPQRRGRARPLGGAWRRRRGASPTGPAPGARRAAARPEPFTCPPERVGPQS